MRTKLLSWALRLACCAVIANLAACVNEDVTDLNKYIAEVKVRPKGPIEPLPEIKVIEPYAFRPEGLRDPFKAMEKAEESENIETVIGNGIKPDLTRRKEELEAFPLESLKMVGTIVMKSNLWALIKADDGTIHRVKEGNYLGKDHGKIIHIVTDKIELMEIVPDKPGTWREQQASLALTE